MEAEFHLDKDRIISQLSLRLLAEEAGAIFHVSSAACPLHSGDNPTAFHLYNHERRWHCFTRCPSGQNDGDLITFYMRWKQVDFSTALRELGERAGLPGKLTKAIKNRSPVPPAGEGGEDALSPIVNSALARPPSPPWLSRAASFLAYARRQLLDPQLGAPARAYLRAERGLFPDTWEVFQLGYNPVTLYDSPERWGLSSGKKIGLPRGIVIPGLKDGQPWYLKIRRPLPGDPLSEYLLLSSPDPVSRLSNLDSRSPKFGGPRGGRSTLFGADLWIGHPVLLLTEGEWDAMLAWQSAGDLCDVATLGSASRGACLPDQTALAGYPLVLAVYDDDPAGDAARSHFCSISRITPLRPPAHDLTDYSRSGGDLRLWIASHVAAQLSKLLSTLDPIRHAQALPDLRLVHTAALHASSP